MNDIDHFHTLFGDKIDPEDLNKGLKYNVQTSTLDDIFNKINPPKLNFIKCDVEGAEYMVLKGGISLIKNTSQLFSVKWDLIM